MNGATQKTGWMGQVGFHISEKTYMKLAGAVHTGNWSAVNAALILTTGKSYGPAPYYGEIPYAGRMISAGFEAGVQKRK